MPEHSDISYFLRDLFPRATPELLRLYESAAKNAALLRSDYDTVRDWLELAGYQEHATLPALLLVLLLALEEGSCCVELAEQSLARPLVDLVGADEAHAWARRLLADLTDDPCAQLIGHEPREHRPIIRYTIGGRTYLYFQRFLVAELRLRDLLTDRLCAAPPTLDPAHVGPVLRQVLHEQPLRLPDGRPLSPDDEQQWALGVALARPLTIISGGPGTGKTSIVLSLLRCLVRLGCSPERIALAAPTGRAAQRLSDALRAGLTTLPSATDAASPDFSLRSLTAGTLHQLLGYRPTRNLFTRHAENPIPADVVVIDEVSMVGVVLMAQLFQALARGTRLILLGDKDQLPSVDTGAVLANLVPDGCATELSPDFCKRLTGLWPELRWPCVETATPLSDSTVVLRTNHRSQAEIRAAAEAINRLDSDLVERLPALRFTAASVEDAAGDDLETAAGCRLLEQVHASPAELRGFLQQWAEQAYFRSRAGGATLAELVRAAESCAGIPDDPAEHDTLRRLFALLERFRLLTLVREGPWGCVEINRFFEQYLRPRLDPGSRPGPFAGAPVLVVRNDPTRGLYNGDVGLALRGRDGELRVVFPRQDGFEALPADGLPAVEPGFALTVHKSQGSEYGRVLIVLPPEGGRRLLTKELLYTAVTRARTLAVLCGTKEVLRFAIGRRITRASGLLSPLRGGPE